jgi:hydroxyacylglutathione hydrolase
MFLKYFYNRQLAHASYMVGCQATGDAIVIDPGRDIKPYLDEADVQEFRITAATETHIHADFVSGARELAAQTGAKLYLSDEGDENWKYQFVDEYDHRLLRDGDVFMVGNIRFEVLHTPGHTPEHISLLLTDTPARGAEGETRPMGIFSGDFVFVGDIGRPDLLEEAAGLAGTADIGARQMFRSLQRFAALPDYVQVWPAHGAGSACGKALGAVPSSTVGYEKIFNWAFSITDEEEFVRTLLAGQPEAPKYFAMMKKLNKEGPPILGALSRPREISLMELDGLLKGDAAVIDVRNSDAFAAAHIPGTINIPFAQSFANWAGWLLAYDKPFYLIVDEAGLDDVVGSLIYIGLDQAEAFLPAAAVQQWEKSGGALQSYATVTASQLAERVIKGDVTVVDVRAQSEWEVGHIPGALHLMLGYLGAATDQVPADRPVAVQCQTGRRSAIGASILQAKGFKDVINMQGGYQDWASAKLPIAREVEAE